MSPWSTLKAEDVVSNAFCCKPVLMAAGYSEELNNACATGLSIATGIWLFRNGCRVAAGADEGVHGALNEAHGLYSCTFPAPLFVQTPLALNPALQSALKSPARSAVVKTLILVDELGMSNRCP